MDLLFLFTTYWPGRLTARISDFQSEDRSSILRQAIVIYFCGGIGRHTALYPKDAENGEMRRY